MEPTTALGISLIDIDVNDIKARWSSLCEGNMSCTAMWGVCGFALCLDVPCEVDTCNRRQGHSNSRCAAQSALC